MTRLLSLFGLMRVSEHEALNSLYHEMAKQRNDALILEAEAVAKFKKAVADLDGWKGKHNSVVGKLNQASLAIEKQAGEIAAYKEGAKALHRGIDDGVAEIKRLTERAAIAEAWAKEQHGLADKYAAELADLRPDALAMRRKRQRDRELKAAKTTGKATP